MSWRCRPAAKGLESGLFDHLGFRVDFHLQLHHVAAFRSAHKAGPDVGIFLRQASDIARVVVMIDYLFAVSHSPLTPSYSSLRKNLAPRRCEKGVKTRI